MSGKPTTPLLAADAIIEIDDKIVLIRRKNEPPGVAIPGGFVDVGECVEAAAIREAKEETGLDVELVELLGVYSDARRDTRGHTVATVFIARATGAPQGGDDAEDAFLVSRAELAAQKYAFDHAVIIADYLEFKNSGKRPAPAEKLARLQQPLLEPGIGG